jgi:hypothetical protein
MVNTTFYLHIKERKVIGWMNYEISKEVMPDDEKQIKISTQNSPDNYIGLEESQIYDDPLPKPAEPSDLPLLVLRRKLKKLHYEIEFTRKIDEDESELLAEYNLKLAEYLQIKNN